jgi:GDP-L-fucose synthase
MFKGKKCAVIGGTGMIGKYIVRYLLDHKAEVYVFSIDSRELCSGGAHFICADMRNRVNALELLKDMNYVFNLAGVKGSPKMTAERPASFFVPMLQFNTNIMESAIVNNFDWYVYTSSVGVYEPAEEFYEDDVWSTFPSQNDKFAGWAKRMGELQAEAYNIQHGWDKFSIVRPANVYGRYDNFDPETGMVIPALIARARGGENPLRVWGDGSAIRDFIHASDVAKGIIHMVEHGVQGPVNLGSGKGNTIKEIADCIGRIMDVEIEWDTTKPSGDAKRIMNIDRAKSFGWEPKISLDTGIADSILWYAEAGGKWLEDRYNSFKEK